MKRFILTALLLALFSCLNGGSIYNYAAINAESAKLFELALEEEKLNTLKAQLIEAIIYVESRGVDSAYNPHEEAVGVMQIRPIMVREVNRVVGYNKYSYTDRWSRDKSVAMFIDLQTKTNPKWDFETACRMWNGGYNWQHKNNTLNYWNKIKTRFISTASKEAKK